MNKIIEQKFLHIFGATKISDIYISSIHNVFKEISTEGDVFDEKNCHQQVVELWEMKHGTILIL